MLNFVTEYSSQILSFLGGLAGGSLLTFQMTKNRAARGGSVVDQSRSRAHGDIVGGNKTSAPHK